MKKETIHIPPLQVDPAQYRTPLFDAMVNLAESRKVSFHTPGHKSGKGISTRFSKYVGHRIFSIDLTTLDEVDSLQRPRGVIKQAQELAAKAYGAQRSFFLVNGTSVGNHAMVMSACGPGTEILMARNCHKSVLAGVILSGATPHFIYPEVDAGLKMTLNVSFEQVAAAIEAHPSVKTLFLTSPNYYGVCAEVGRITDFAHGRDITVLVDEAHGPHLGFHPGLPVSAMSAGADMCVQSTHKIIGGMTQASMMHMQGGRVDPETVAGVLKFMQTTSPSYILMASLDLARMQMATEGEKLLGGALEFATYARDEINRIPGLRCLDADTAMRLGAGGLDETKLAINVDETGLTGYEVSRILNLEHDIQVEMADPANVLVIVSIGDRRTDIELLLEALRSVAASANGAVEKISPWESGVPLFRNQSGLTPREAFFAPHENISLEDSAGRLSSEIITVYPPGIPILVPGEVITEEVTGYLRSVSRMGGIVDGLAEDGSIGVVK